MAKYYVNAPDRQQVSVSTPYGIQNFVHGTYITDDNYARVYPQFFILVPDIQPTVNEPEKEKTPVKEKTIVDKTTTKKKKVGLPKKKL